MSSFLIKCDQCGVTFCKDTPCPQCGWGDEIAAPTEKDELLIQVFSQRTQTHKRNYMIFMFLTLVTGLVAMLTTGMWGMVIYRGNIAAFFLIGLLTVASGVLAVILAFSKKIFPTELFCPACDLRLDELGTTDGKCPNCSAQLEAAPNAPAGKRLETAGV